MQRAGRVGVGAAHGECIAALFALQADAEAADPHRALALAQQGRDLVAGQALGMAGAVLQAVEHGADGRLADLDAAAPTDPELAVGVQRQRLDAAGLVDRRQPAQRGVAGGELAEPAVLQADPDAALGIAGDRLHRRHAARQRQVLGLAGAGAQPRQAAPMADPQRALGIQVQCHDAVVRQCQALEAAAGQDIALQALAQSGHPDLVRIGGQRAHRRMRRRQAAQAEHAVAVGLVDEQTLGLAADPHATVGAGGQRAHPAEIALHRPRRIALDGLQAVAIPARQAVAGADPEQALAVLGQAGDDAARHRHAAEAARRGGALVVGAGCRQPEGDGQQHRGGAPAPGPVREPFLDGLGGGGSSHARMLRPPGSGGRPGFP